MMVVVVGAVCTWGVVGVEGEWESGGSGSIGVGGWREGWMSGLESMEINLLLW